MVFSCGSIIDAFHSCQIQRHFSRLSGTKHISPKTKLTNQILLDRGDTWFQCFWTDSIKQETTPDSCLFYVPKPITSPAGKCQYPLVWYRICKLQETFQCLSQVSNKGKYQKKPRNLLKNQNKWLVQTGVMFLNKVEITEWRNNYANSRTNNIEVSVQFLFNLKWPLCLVPRIRTWPQHPM